MFAFRPLVGCSSYQSESGEAFEPWVFPGNAVLPEMVAAHAAILAASPHNTQPWALHVTATRIDLHADFTRSLGSIDAQQRELHIGLGCALENLVVAARAHGREPTVELLPDADNPSLVASIALVPAAPAKDPLFAAIARRHTSRGRYAATPPAAALESTLRALIGEPGIQLHFIGTDAQKAEFGAKTIEATEAFIADAEMSRDSNAWYRHSANDILVHRDGVTLDASGNGAATRTFGKMGSGPSNETADAYWLKGTRDRQTTCSAFCVLSSPLRNTREDQLLVGRVYQRMHLWGTSQGLAMQPLNQLVEMQEREQIQQRPLRFGVALDGFVANAEQRAQMLFRIGYAWDDALQSPRRPLAWVTL